MAVLGRTRSRHRRWAAESAGVADRWAGRMGRHEGRGRLHLGRPAAGDLDGGAGYRRRGWGRGPAPHRHRQATGPASQAPDHQPAHHGPNRRQQQQQPEPVGDEARNGDEDPGAQQQDAVHQLTAGDLAAGNPVPGPAPDAQTLAPHEARARGADQQEGQHGGHGADGVGHLDDHVDLGDGNRHQHEDGDEGHRPRLCGGRPQGPRRRAVAWARAIGRPRA